MTGDWGWHWGFRGLGLLGGLAMVLFWIAVIGLVIWLLVRLVRSTASQPVRPAPPQAQPTDPALEILRRRLAEGAITPQEFDELRQKLGV